MQTDSVYTALTAGTVFEDPQFYLRGRYSEVRADLSAGLVPLGIETTAVEKDEGNWYILMTVLGITVNEDPPVEVRIDLADGWVELKVAMDPLALAGDRESVQAAVRTIDQLVDDLGPVIESTIRAHRATPPVPCLSEGLPDDVPF